MAEDPNLAPVRGTTTISSAISKVALDQSNLEILVGALTGSGRKPKQNKKQKEGEMTLAFLLFFVTSGRQ